jgi:uncharacterized protein
MPLSMYQASVPIFTQVLAALGNVMGKAEAYAAAKKFDPAVLIAARLAPDMLPLGRQVQLASDFAKGAAARLSGSDIPSWPDTEKTSSRSSKGASRGPSTTSRPSSRRLSTARRRAMSR